MVNGAGYKLDFQGNPCPILPEVRLCYSFYSSIVPAVATLDSIIFDFSLQFSHKPKIL